MKTRDYGFLLAGLIIGAGVCAAFIASHRSAPHPAAVSLSTPVIPTASSEVVSLSYQPGGNVYLAGEVHQQGAVKIRPNETLTVSQAIALDGGVASKANAENISLMRRRADGTSDIIPVDLKISDNGYAKDPTVKPGDLINVPEVTIAR